MSHYERCLKSEPSCVPTKAKDSILLPDLELPLWDSLGIMVFTIPDGLQGPVKLGGMGNCLCIHHGKIVVRILELAEWYLYI